jgi:hypothetical protein
MSALQIQKLRIDNCEQAIERSYFDWGSERTKGGQTEPDWAAASDGVRRHVALQGYLAYDGCPAQKDCSLSAADVCLSVGVNSRVTLFDVVRVLNRADEARPLLSRIPAEACLEEGTADEIEAAAYVIDLLAQPYMMGRGKATKILYKKRPAFIPVIDSVVGDFLWKSFPHRIKQSSPVHDVLVLYRELLIARSRTLKTVQVYAASRGLELTTSRLLSHLIWLGWQGNVDSFGFGPPITDVWQATGLAEARRLARDCWNVGWQER